MRHLRILLGKELGATFTSPIAYAVATVFLVVLGYTFSLTLFFTKVANLTYIFHQIYVLLILLVPILTMRVFADEAGWEQPVTLGGLVGAPHQQHRAAALDQQAGAQPVLGVIGPAAAGARRPALRFRPSIRLAARSARPSGR